MLDAMELFAGADLAGDDAWAALHYEQLWTYWSEFLGSGASVATAANAVNDYFQGLVGPNLLNHALPSQADLTRTACSRPFTVKSLQHFSQPLRPEGGRSEQR